MENKIRQRYPAFFDIVFHEICEHCLGYGNNPFFHDSHQRCMDTSSQPVVVIKPVDGSMISFNESDNGKAFEIPGIQNFL